MDGVEDVDGAAVEHNLELGPGSQLQWIFLSIFEDMMFTLSHTIYGTIVYFTYMNGCF